MCSQNANNMMKIFLFENVSSQPLERLWLPNELIEVTDTYKMNRMKIQRKKCVCVSTKCQISAIITAVLLLFIPIMSFLSLSFTAFSFVFLVVE